MLLRQMQRKKLNESMTQIEQYLTKDIAELLHEPLVVCFGNWGDGDRYALEVSAGGAERTVHITDIEEENGSIVVKEVKRWTLSELAQGTDEDNNDDMAVSLIWEWQDVKKQLLEQKRNTERVLEAIEKFEV